MHTASKHKEQLIGSNQSTHNTLFYAHLSTTGKFSVGVKKGGENY